MVRHLQALPSCTLSFRLMDDQKKSCLLVPLRSLGGARLLGSDEIEIRIWLRPYALDPKHRVDRRIYFARSSPSIIDACISKRSKIA
jgi:hypothetical protein